MKTIFCFFYLILLLHFSAFSQAVDTAAVEKEVDSLIQISRDYANKRIFDPALQYSAAAEKIARERLGEISAAYGAACFNQGRVYSFKGDYGPAEIWYLKSIDVRKRVFGTEHLLYAQSLNNLGVMYWRQGKFDKTEPLYRESKEIRERILGKDHIDYAMAANNLAVVYNDMGYYDKSEPLHEEALAVRKKKLGVLHPDYAQSVNNLAAVYYNIGKYEKAMPLWLESMEIRKNSLGKNSPEYAQSLGNIAAIYWELADYKKAEACWLEAAAIIENTLGQNRIEYCQNIDNLATLHFKLGNYPRSLALHSQSMAIKEKITEKNSANYCLSLNNLALVYSGMGNISKSIELHQEALDIFEKLPNPDSSIYALILNNLGIIYSGAGDNSKATTCFLKAKNIRERIMGKKHPVYVESLNNIGNEYRISGNYEMAETILLEAKSSLEASFNKGTPNYSKCLNNLARLYWSTGRVDSAGAYIRRITAAEKSQLLKSAQFLAEYELSSNISQYKASVDQKFSFTHASSANTGNSYENALFYKGFLINTSIKTNKIATSDPKITDKINLLKSYHRRLAAEYAKPTTERKNVAELEEKANTLEKELVRTVAGYGEAIRQVNWQEVQAALKPGEAAIEYIRFHYYNPKPTDSILYAALVLTPGMSAPVFVSLFEEKQLDALLAPHASKGSSGFNTLYGGTTSQALYRLLWAPLETQLAGAKTLYISPAGQLYRLNIGAIVNPEGKTLSDRFQLVRLNSTRQLVESVRIEAPATAVVFGGIRFDIDSTTQHTRAIPAGDKGRGLSFEQSDSTLRGGAWQYLKWSEKEADNVSGMLSKTGLSVTTHKGWDATEEAFKQIGKGSPSPRILHLSTHGFFFPDPERDAAAGAIPADHEPVFKISDHPMIRSGLVLAGGNHAWKTGKPFGEREDGILTAYEISQMDLNHTELVVLSACETGLGQIEGNEGVYGLQRAFKIAGAKNLVMSLWQVPDYQTQELMTAFYRNLGDGKMPAREALQEAQNEMRQKRYEPYFWAGFILVE